MTLFIIFFLSRLKNKMHDLICSNICLIATLLCEVNSYNGKQKQSFEIKMFTKTGKEENDHLPGRFQELELDF